MFLGMSNGIGKMAEGVSVAGGFSADEGSRSIIPAGRKVCPKVSPVGASFSLQRPSEYREQNGGKRVIVIGF